MISSNTRDISISNLLNKTIYNHAQSLQKGAFMTAKVGKQTNAQSDDEYLLMGTHFVLDEDKILREDRYDLEGMYEKIAEMAKEAGLIKIDKNTYHCRGDKYDLACLGVFVYKWLMKCEWFCQNVKEWTWIDEEEGNESLMGDEMGAW